MSAVLVTDARGRATLGPKEQTFKVTELDGGALLLEPARVLTEIEIAALQTPGLIDQVNASMARPTEGRKYRKRS
ncbi:hypothetical protein [Arachnia propionica]|uniref:Uncharacterized protein n=1 Tax=Arachnia propionica TaxID=1750 RepID=A0A3P1WSB8_9ACTN|nr:hypothetical protein [Arachnia propionica]RRD49529.1 hypothetical protein EII35_07985 [Arachnia propionica]